MKVKLSLITSLLATVFFSGASFAQPLIEYWEKIDCSWQSDHGGFGTLSDGFYIYDYESCYYQGVAAAKRSSIIYYFYSVGEPEYHCSALRVEDSANYRVEGSCEFPVVSPVVYKKMFAQSKICEFGDPSLGTTPGCTQRVVGGSSIPNGTSAGVKIEKNGTHLLYATKNTIITSSGAESCTWRDDGGLFKIESLSCDHFRVYL